MSYPYFAAGLVVGAAVAYWYFRRRMMQEIVHVL